MKCIMKKLFPCTAYKVYKLLPFLVRAVNKLTNSVGEVSHIEYKEDNSGIELEVMQECIETIKRVSKSLDMTRLERVAREEESLEEQKTFQEVCEVTEKRRKLALSLIKYRDQLLYFKDNASAEGNEQMVKLLDNLYRETGRFMRENGVEPLEDNTTFHAEYHVITDTEETEQIDLHDRIASTFRAGYRIDGELIRPQEVVVYRYSSSDDDLSD